mmetsp:Transcript_19680/g.38477  ORF Transcript_19680/g.38477 Transcript_19680/m.38477 type:complete len:212 (-) Transcript_19680:1403-2038(-)
MKVLASGLEDLQYVLKAVGLTQSEGEDGGDPKRQYLGDLEVRKADNFCVADVLLEKDVSATLKGIALAIKDRKAVVFVGGSSEGNNSAAGIHDEEQDSFENGQVEVPRQHQEGHSGPEATWEDVEQEVQDLAVSCGEQVLTLAIPGSEDLGIDLDDNSACEEMAWKLARALKRAGRVAMVRFKPKGAQVNIVVKQESAEVSTQKNLRCFQS